MSAFIVNADTMQDVITAFMSYNYNQQQSTMTNQLLADKMGETLYDMNYDAIWQRYPDTFGNPEATPGPIPAPDPKEFRWTRMVEFENEIFDPTHQSATLTNRKAQCRQLKAIQCLIYQCSEGDVPECDEYKALVALSQQLAMAIARSLPEYEQAPWSD